MPATTEPPTWQIRPTSGGRFQWAASESGVPQEPLLETLASGEENHSDRRLPSMADLLNLAHAKILEGDNGGKGDDEGPLMPRTGTGSSVPASEGSIRKARSVGGGVHATGTGESANRDVTHLSVDNEGDCDPLFRTGSGRSVTLRESSIHTAATILHGKVMNNGSKGHAGADTKCDGFPLFSTASGKSVTIRKSSIRQAAAILEEKEMNNGNKKHSDFDPKDNKFPLFCTGSGRPVPITESSIKKAAAIIEGKDIHYNVGTNDNAFPWFRTGSEKSVTVRESSIRKAEAILEGKDMNNGNELNEAYSEINTKNNGFPLFSTGSGKSVTVRESSIRKAAAILEGKVMDNGLGAEDNGFPLFCIAPEKSVAVQESSIWKAAAILGGQDMNNDTDIKDIVYPLVFNGSGKSATVKEISMRKVAANLRGEEIHIRNEAHSDVSSKDNGFPLFSTGSGKSVTIKESSIRKATVILDRNTMSNGGQYNSLPNDAPTNARSLFGDKDTKSAEDHIMLDQYCLERKRNYDETFWNKENISSDSLYYEGTSNYFYRTLPSLSKRNQPSSLIRKSKTEDYRVDQRNAKIFTLVNDSTGKKLHLNQKPGNIPLGGVHVGISNNTSAEQPDANLLPSEKRQSGRMSYVSPFKRPRSSRFSTPLKDTSFLATGSSKLSTIQSTKLSTRYPFQTKRKSIKDFFGCPPSHQNLSSSVPSEVRSMDADNALIYRFHDPSAHEEIGVPVFQDMLLQAGASPSLATKEWIVWKLACYERCYPTQTKCKFLSVSNVLEELKYRYAREANHGHRSAIKRILDGDASPASMMVLCVAAIHSTQPDVPKTDDMSCPEEYANKANNSFLTMENGYCGTRIELTDGWYSLNALPDMWLSKELVAGKLFVGQKLLICCACLRGWVGPVSPLEASKTIYLQIHINGTYRAYWDDKLGFCRNPSSPLAFRCIKVAGGKVPRTLVGITRIYPVLYKERFNEGGYIIRSEVLEKKALQNYAQRRYDIAEAIMSEQLDVVANINDSDEGAKLYKKLEMAAEPEVLMADMTSEQLCSFSAYHAKQKEISQVDMQNKIEKALKDAELGSRDVTPFMKVRVVGLTSKNSCRKGIFREGVITIWKPTEGQRVDLEEGKIYDVAGLTPTNCGMDVLHLQGAGSSIMWKSLPPEEADKYEPFFNPRKSVILSNLGDIPLASEFDIAAVVLHIEDVCFSGRQKKQWVFVSDGCNCSSALHSVGLHDCLLAISFSSSLIDSDSSSLFSHHHEGTVVGFLNLVKRARDQANHLWVAEATNHSTYSACHNLPRNCHLTVEATSVKKWAKAYCSTMQKLKKRILYILGHHET